VRGGAVTWAEAMLSAADSFLASSSTATAGAAASTEAGQTHAVCAAGKHGTVVMLWESAAGGGSDPGGCQPCGVLWSRSRHSAQTLLLAHAVVFHEEDVTSLLTSAAQKPNGRLSEASAATSAPRPRSGQRAALSGKRTGASSQPKRGRDKLASEAPQADSDEDRPPAAGQDDEDLVMSDLAAYRATMGADASIQARAAGSERSRRTGAFFVVRGRANVLALASALAHSVCTDARVLGGSADGHKLPHLSCTQPFEHGAAYACRASCRKLAGEAGGWMAVLSPVPPMQASCITATIALRQLLTNSISHSAGVSAGAAGGKLGPAPALDLSIRTLWAAPGPRLLRQTARAMLEESPAVDPLDPTASAAAAIKQVERGACAPSAVAAASPSASVPLRATLTARSALVSGAASSSSAAAGLDDGDEDDDAWLAELLDDGEPDTEPAPSTPAAAASDLPVPLVHHGWMDSRLRELLAEHSLRWKCVSER
jgi:hypothetical protein